VSSKIVKNFEKIIEDAMYYFGESVKCFDTPVRINATLFFAPFAPPCEADAHRRNGDRYPCVPACPNPQGPLYLKARSKPMRTYSSRDDKKDFIDAGASGVLPQGKTMTLHERLAVGAKVVELEKQGKFEEAKRLHDTIPIQPYLVKFYKDHLGLEALLKTGWNFAAAVEEYGPEFLTR
jgi:hypothetical protein